MSEYTPTVYDIKLAYCDSDWTGHDYAAQAPEFDRWLAAHDREVSAKAWDEAVGFFEENFYGETTSARHFNPYKNGETL